LFEKDAKIIFGFEKTLRLFETSCVFINKRHFSPMAILHKSFSAISSNTRLNPIFIQLIRLSLPVIATSFMSMAYSFINIAFVGKLGSEAVAAVGSASFYMNLSWSISALLTVGAGIKVSHAIGENNTHIAKSYVRSGIVGIVGLAFFFFLFLVFANDFLISLIRLNNPFIEQAAKDYLLIVSLSILFVFQNLFFSSVFVGYGDSKSPFTINCIALSLNILLDYILIFQVHLGITGAAVATIISQSVATLLFYIKLNRTTGLKPQSIAFRYSLLKQMIGLGTYPAIQRTTFTIIAILMARIISEWGATAIAVQKVGVQIEAVSYMTAGGFMSALSAISGQAYGAKDYDTQWKAFRSGMTLAFSIGIITSVVLIVFSKSLFSIFLSDAQSVVMGKEYLIILGTSQLFVCLELMATGAFFGWGRTHIPAITGITLTVLRIPMALAFIHLWKHSLASIW
jgi:putative MATE family efflux protein